MSYSCTDFTDDILNALQVKVPELLWDEPQGQATLAKAAIDKLRNDRAALLKALKALRGELELISGYWTEGLDNFVQQADQVIEKVEG